MPSIGLTLDEGDVVNVTGRVAPHRGTSSSLVVTSAADIQRSAGLQAGRTALLVADSTVPMGPHPVREDVPVVVEPR